MYQSTKIISGFSTCFRQWRAINSHCSYLHGYAISFKLVFEAETLDNKNWVQDFGFGKSKLKNVYGLPLRVSTIKDWFNYMFDHTTIIAKDDPGYNKFEIMDTLALIQLRTLDNVGCEAFAKFVFDFITKEIKNKNKTDNRIKLLSVECIENPNNSAIYFGESEKK